MTLDRETEIRGQLIECADQLKAMIDAAIVKHERDKTEAWSPDPVPDYWTVWSRLDANGRPLLADLVAARANVLLALAKADSS